MSATQGAALSPSNLSPSEEATSTPATYILEDVIIPRMSEAVSSATITKWHKKVGEEVRRDEPLYDISTSKVDAEMSSPCSGVLFEIRVLAGQTTQVDTVVARIRSPNDSRRS
jgi:pyruvate dehydrogenase E2 component (dihydrolipoamide acetyltransferase)